jgi:hypothetical protein
MNTKRRAAWLLSLALGALSGCQTWVPEAGLTLPSPDYLRHQPQYFPPSPPFGLSRELASIEQAAAQQAPNPPAPGFGQ